MSCAQKSNGTASQDLCLACGLCCDGTIFADVQLQTGDDAARLTALGLRLKVLKRRQQNQPTQNGDSPTLAPKTAGDGTQTKSPRYGRLESLRYVKLAQPCAAFQNGRCGIYEGRPNYCRAFECLLLKSVNAGKTEKAMALKIIRTARRRADKVVALLRQLGEPNEFLSLRQRFGRVSKRVQRDGLDEETAQLYGELTLAMHELNLILSEAFYPGATER